MDLEILRDYALSFKSVTEGFPFDEHTLVFKVANKMFLLSSLQHQPLRFNFKHSPENGIEYRERYSSVVEGYHMHKKYWSTVSVDGEVSEEELRNWISDSYDLVVSGLPKYKQKELKQHD